MLVPDLSPGELAVSVTVQPDGIGEVAQRDVPLPFNVIFLNRQGKIAVAGLVSPSRKTEQKPGGDEQDADQGRQWRPLPSPKRFAQADRIAQWFDVPKRTPRRVARYGLDGQPLCGSYRHIGFCAERGAFSQLLECCLLNLFRKLSQPKVFHAVGLQPINHGLGRRWVLSGERTFEENSGVRRLSLNVPIGLG